MAFYNSFKSDLALLTQENFSDAALALFQYQAQNNIIYKKIPAPLGL